MRQTHGATRDAPLFAYENVISLANLLRNDIIYDKETERKKVTATAIASSRVCKEDFVKKKGKFRKMSVSPFCYIFKFQGRYLARY